MSLATIDDASSQEAPPTLPENIGRTLWAFAWPAVAVNSLQVVNNLLDRFFIGHLPQASLTAQSAAMNLMFLLFSLAMAISTGSGAIVARAYGAGEKAEYREAARQSTRLALASAVILGALGFLFTPMFASALLPVGEKEAANQMIQFLGLYVLGLPAIYIIQTLAGSLRGVGDTRSPMWISGFQILLHMGLNTVLIFPARTLGDTGFTLYGANMGLNGAAIALSVSAWVAAAIYLLYAKNTPLGAVWPTSLPKWDWAQRILRIAVPSAGMAILRVASLTAFTLVLRHTPTGAMAIAGLGVAFAIESIMFMPPFGLSMASSALVGQSLGAKQPERAERIGWLASHYGALVVLIVVIPIYLGSNRIVATMIEAKPAVSSSTSNKALPVLADTEFEKKKQSQNEAANLLRWLCVTEIFFSYAMILIGAMQGAGDTVRPLVITVISLWLVRVPLAYLLAIPVGWGSTGAWISMSVSQALQGILAIYYFRKGIWKTLKV